jgi:hypothetical protein
MSESFPFTNAARDVLAERKRQIEKEGYDAAHDDEHAPQELADAAACYAIKTGSREWGLKGSQPPPYWPWEREAWNPKDQRRNLVRAGALILAAIEHIDRAASTVPDGVKGGDDV